jgi:hypothetical protein
MSSISAGTTTGTALVSTGDTTGELVLKTNGTTTAVTIGTNQVVTLAQPLPAGSGGTGLTAFPAPGTSGNLLTSDGTAWTSAAGVVVGPTFRAFRTTSSQSVTGGVYTKIEFNGETFDTASAYDNVTNYRFTPQTAGYYIVSVAASISQPFNTDTRVLAIYKNGSIYSAVYGGGTAGGAIATDVVYFNGTTDYVEGYAYVDSNSSIANSTSTAYFSATYARGT